MRRSVATTAAITATLMLGAGSAFVISPSASAAKRKPAAKTTVASGVRPGATAGAAKTAEPSTTTPARDLCAVRIMPLGDSITGFPDGYRGPLYRKLRERKLSVDFVGSVTWDPTGGGDPNGEGHGGFTIGPDDRLDGEGKPGNLAQRVAEWIPKADPDIIVLQIGTNDLGAGTEFAARAPARLQGLVTQLTQLAPDAWIVLGTLIPIRGWKEGRPEVQAYNDAIRALGSARLDDRVVTAELWDFLPALGYDTERDTSDGTHPNAAGGDKMATAFLPWIVPMIERKAAAVCK